MSRARQAERSASPRCEAPYMDAKNLAPTLDNDDNCRLDPGGRECRFSGLFPP
jgi:hypothetical protein